MKCSEGNSFAAFVPAAGRLSFSALDMANRGKGKAKSVPTSTKNF